MTCDDGTSTDISSRRRHGRDRHGHQGRFVLHGQGDDADLPAGFTGTITVTYNPTDAETARHHDGVQIPEDGDSDVVTVTNDYAGVQVEAAAAVVIGQPAFTG